jgi:predicted Rossmann fold flavoprotein
MKQTRVYDLIVIGGGAAGFFGAVNFALAKPGARVLILEKSQKLLSKVAVSGGGRCNVTHRCFDPTELVKYYPRGGKELLQAFMRFQPKDTVEWFESRGLKLKTEADGRMFPVTDKSQSVIDVLMTEARKYGVEIQIGVTVTYIHRQTDMFELQASNQVYHSKNLLLACGGFAKKTSYAFIETLGIQMIDPVPSLFTFIVNDSELTSLPGISVEEAEVSSSLQKQKFKGPLLITHQGLSGPAVLKLSAFGAIVFHQCNYQFTLGINWAGGMGQEAIRTMLTELKQANEKKLAANAKPGIFPQRLWNYFLLKCGIWEEQRWADTGNKQLNKLTELLCRQEVKIIGKNTFKEEFVTAGGINLKEVDFKSMECKKVPGLYVAGELLNIDGVTGGFNFQSAWTTSWIAAQHMADSFTMSA